MELPELKERVKDIALTSGAIRVGIGTKDRLSAAPPSADMDYSLPGAQSCIIWAYPIPISTLESYLSKKERMSYKQNLYFAYSNAWLTAVHIAQYIEKNSNYKAKPVIPNVGYRGTGRRFKLRLRVGKALLRLGLGKRIIVKIIARTFGARAIPMFSLRYGAVAAGLGRIGWSGNIFVKDYGSAVYLAGVLTTAPLEPDTLAEDPLCNKCKTCVQACPTGLFSLDEAEPPVTIAGRQEIYAKRNSYARCYFGCGGLAGLGPGGKWSTWTPDLECLKEVPEEQMNDPRFRERLLHKLLVAKETPRVQREFNKKILIEYMNGGILGNIGLRSLEDTHPTCGACQAVCVADPKQRKRLLHQLQTSGSLFLNAQGNEVVRRVGEDGKISEFIPPLELQ